MQGNELLWANCSKKQVIFETETFAALLALLLWADDCQGVNVFFIVDNEACKFIHLKGMADNPTEDKLAELFLRVEDLNNLCV